MKNLTKVNYLNQNFWLMNAGLMGFLGVALGAFGSHGLENQLSERMMEIYKVGIFYHIIHAVAILVIALNGSEKYFTAAAFFFVGILFFSFSLYAYATTGISYIAMITPIGGVLFLIGWGSILVKSARKNSVLFNN